MSKKNKKIGSLSYCIGSKQESSQGKEENYLYFFRYRNLINVFEINPNKSFLIFQVLCTFKVASEIPVGLRHSGLSIPQVEICLF